MNPQTFFNHFARLTDAPNAIPRLRELILQFAVQGKLVIQDERNEPATCLLEHISAERRYPIRESSIRDDKSLPEDNALPIGWEIEKLGNIANAITKGATPTTYGYKFQNEGVRFVKVENVKNGRIVIEGIKDFISEEAHQAQKRSQLEVYDVLFSIAGTIGETCIVKQDDLPANTNQALAIIRGTRQIFLPEFLKLQLDSFVANAVRNRARGGAMNNVSLGDLKELTVYIPPLEEQARIVAKVDELMWLCDEVERLQAERRASRQRLNRAATDHLLAARDAAEFQAYWLTIRDQFPTLTAALGQIGTLRQTLLQLAIQGKLAAQDPSEESAKHLLDQILAERKKLWMERETLKRESRRKNQNLKALVSKYADPMGPSIENLPVLPTGWAWCSLEQISEHIVDGTHHTPTYVVDGVPFISAKDIVNGEIDFSGCRYISEDEYEQLIQRCKPKLGDILVSKSGSIGKVAVVTTHKQFTLFESVALIPIIGELSRKFISTAIYLSASGAFGADNQKGMAVRHLHLNNLRQMPLPLPPLEEQKRIVIVINRLMTLCDELEADLRRAEENGERLLRSVMRSLLAPAFRNSVEVAALAVQ